MWLSYNAQWKLLREYQRGKLSKDKEKLAKEQRFHTFFRHSLLPKRLIYKFDIVIENNKEHWKSGNTSSFFSPRNVKVIKILMRMYMAMFLGVLYSYRDVDRKQDIYIEKLHDIAIFSYFNNFNFKEYYNNNNNIQYITKSYCLDSKLDMTFINYYNLNLFLYLDIFQVLFNFEYYKYEDDKILYSNSTVKNYKNKKKVLMHTDFFSFIWRRNKIRKISKYNWKLPFFNQYWNKIDPEDDDISLIKETRDKKNTIKHLMWQPNLFFCFIMYECCIYIFKDLLINYFNFDFFSKCIIFKKKNKKKINKTKIKNNFLTSTYYNFNMDFLNIKAKRNNDIQKLLYNKFNLKYNILDIKHFNIKMPFVFYLLYTFYSIYYRRARYNFYIRGEKFFQEHFSRMYYFLWRNSGGARAIARKFGKTKIKKKVIGMNVMSYTLYKYQKLFTLYHFKTYLEMAWFNEWFCFYEAWYAQLIDYIELNAKQHKYNFMYLLNNDYMNKLLHVKINEDNKKYYLHFFYGYALKYHYMYDLFNGYELFMNTPVTRFENVFKMGRLGFKKYDEMIDHIFLIPIDRRRLVKYIDHLIMKDHIFNMYNDLNVSYSNLYFLKDFINLYEINDYNKSLKLYNFYEKIFSMLFLLIDPFFFKYFWRRSFPRKLHKIRWVQNYIMSILIMQRQDVFGFEFDIAKYNFLIQFLSWRIDSGNFIAINDAYSNKIARSHIIINTTYKNRFIELIKQIHYLLNEENVINKFRYYYNYYLVILKNYYFDLLYYNIEYTLIFFLINTNKYIKLANNTIMSLDKIIYSEFIYRYYIYKLLLNAHHYDDWFVNWNKRILWIYRKFVDHEGPRFYRNKQEII